MSDRPHKRVRAAKAAVDAAVAVARVNPTIARHMAFALQFGKS